jgi:hypothetical protein
MILSGVGFRPSNPNPDLGDAVALMLLGGGALGIAVAAEAGAKRDATAAPAALAAPTESALRPARSSWVAVMAGLTLLLVVAEINGRFFGLEFMQRVSYHLQALLFFGGIALTVWGLSGAPRITPRAFNPAQALTRAQQIEWGCVAGLVLLAFVVRAVGLETTLRVSIDEGVAIPGIFHNWNPTDVGLVAPPSAYQTTLVYSHWQTIMVSLFGQTLTGFRITSAIVGALTVVAVYVLARALFDLPTALLAALLLATFPPHLHFSRIGLLHIADPLFGTFALAFMVRGLKHNLRRDWALAGAMLGLTHYFFEAGRLFFTPLVVGWVVLMLLTQRRRLYPQWRGLVAMGLALLFTITPAYYTLFVREQNSAARLQESGLSTEFWTSRLEDGLTREELEQIAHRVTFPFQVYVHQPEIAVFYGGDQALVTEPLVPLFLLGCFYLLWRSRTPAMIVILWIIATALVNALLRDSAVHARWVVGFPAIALAMAVALRSALPMLLPRGLRPLAAAPLALLVIVIAIGQAAYYFGPHLTLLNVQARASKPYRDALDAALRAVESLPDNTEIVIISDPIADANVPRAFLGFMLEDPLAMTLRTFTPAEMTPEFFDSLPPERNVAFFVEPDDVRTLETLQAHYRLSPPETSPYDIPADKVYTLFFAPAGSRIT